MASGDVLFMLTPRHATYDDATAATFDLIAIDSNSQEEVLDFDGGGTDEGCTLKTVVPAHYDGGGIDLTVGYSTDGTNTNAVEWDFQFMAVGDGEDYDTKTFNATVTTITDTPSSASANAVNISAATSITHANVDSPAAREAWYIKVVRTSSTDTNTDDAQLHWLYATET